MEYNMIAWHDTSAPADMWCSRCDKKLMSREIEYAWVGHDVHAHLQVMSGCCFAAVVDRPEAHLPGTRAERQAARRPDYPPPSALPRNNAPRV